MQQNSLHQKALDIMLNLKAKDSSLTFWFRKVNRDDKLQRGIWFQGNDGYAFVGLYNRGGGTNMTRSFGVVFFELPDGEIQIKLENAFNEEQDEKVLLFYENARNLIGGFENMGKTNFQKFFNQGNALEELEQFLLIQKPKLDSLLREMQLESFFITEGDFQTNYSRIKKYMEEDSRVESEDFTEINARPNRAKSNHPLNQILYGPPGTGKTYNTINKALSIIQDIEIQELEKKNRDDLKKDFDEYARKGQIVFTTFHQSMSYEDFIEGIKPLKPEMGKPISYDIQDGVFKVISNKAFSNLIPKNEMESFKMSLPFDDIHSGFLEKIKRELNKGEYTFFTLYKHEVKVIEVKESSIIVIFKWQDKNKSKPATQPFSITKEKLRQLFEGGLVPENVKSLKESFYPFYKHNISVYFAVYKDFYAFAKSQTGIDSFEEFDEAQDLSFTEINESWDSLSKVEKKEALSIANPYVLIIDEINRGNVSQVFGELITLIEDNKRIGGAEALEVVLPYSKMNFGVPANLHIIGTMNTADRSVEALDSALRRRFVFEEMPPLYDLEELNSLVAGYTTGDILKTINERIEVLLDRDHLIGHSYFLKKDSESLMHSFNNCIIPLLQEYFYGDYSKIGMVLGDGLVELKSNQVHFAHFNHKSAGSYESNDERYLLTKITDVETFEAAIHNLMNRNGI